MRIASFLIMAAAILTGCSTANSNYREGSGFTKKSRLSLSDTTPTGMALRPELFARGFNMVDAGSNPQPEFNMRLIVRRSWRGVISGVVPGTVEVVVTSAKTGDVVATSSYDLGSMSYSSTQDAAEMIAESLSEQVP